MWHMMHASRFILLDIGNADCNRTGPVAYDISLEVPGGWKSVCTMAYKDGLSWMGMLELTCHLIHEKCPRYQMQEELCYIDRNRLESNLSDHVRLD